VRSFPLLFIVVLVLSVGCNQQKTKNHLERVQALNLQSFNENGLPTYYSSGREARARTFANFINGMVTFYSDQSGWKITPQLAVLSEADWRATIEILTACPPSDNPAQ
jgi:hypothetical protein